MTDFTLDDVGGSASVLAKVREAWLEVEIAIRSTDEDGGQLMDMRLEMAAEGARRGLEKLQPLGPKALEDHAAETLFDHALIAVGMSPAVYKNPCRRD